MPLRPTLLRAARVRTTLKKLGITALKIDIEGAEAVVFGKASSSWLDMVDMIAVELHDDLIFGNATDIFLNAVKSQGLIFRTVANLRSANGDSFHNGCQTLVLLLGMTASIVLSAPSDCSLHAVQRLMDWPTLPALNKPLRSRSSRTI